MLSVCNSVEEYNVVIFWWRRQAAHKWLLAYQASGRVGDLSQAWDVYYHVFRKINKLLPALTTLELQHVSPTLLAAHDLELGVPGTYMADAAVTRIMSCCPDSRNPNGVGWGSVLSKAASRHTR